MFKVTSGKGLQMTFANGWTVSVQFGAGNYCDHYNRSWAPDGEDVNELCGAQGSTTAEIAAWDKDGNWHDFGGDKVKGYVNADDVAHFIKFIADK